MMLAEATQRLVELHDTTLRRLHDTIREHKYALRDLIEQAQEEVTALARPVAVVCEQVANGDEMQENGAEAGPPFQNSKRKAATAGNADTEDNAASKPIKRGRGRPAKQRQPLPAVEEDDASAVIAAAPASHEQQACSNDSEQPSVSATVRASALDVPQIEAGDDATSAPTGARRSRTTRCRAAAASMPTVASASTAGTSAPSRSNRCKRSAAAPSAGCSTRSTRRRAATATETVLPAIEEDEKEMPEIEDMQHIDKTALTSPGGMAAAKDDAKAAAADIAVHQAEQDDCPEKDPCVPEKLEPAAAVAARTAQFDADDDGVNGDVDTRAVTEREASTAADDVVALIEYDIGIGAQEAAAAVDGAETQDDTGNGEDHHRTQLSCFAQPREQPEPGVAAACAGPPNTPGFSLKPANGQQADTPCLVFQPSSAAGRHSMRSQQQSADGQQRVCPAEAAAAVPDLAVDAIAQASGPSMAPGETALPRSTRKSRRHSCLKGPSLSFGECLHGPVLEEQQAPADTIDAAFQPDEAAAAHASKASESTDPCEPSLSLAAADGGAAQGAATWQNFVSSMHATDAPTPAAHRSRQRSHSGAIVGGCGGNHGSAMQPATAGTADGDVAKRAAVGYGVERRSTRASTQRFHSPLGHVIPEARAAATAFTMEQEHLPQHQLPMQTPSAVRQQQQQQQHDIRSSKSRTPRSARRSEIGLEAALEAAAAEKEEQDALLLQHQQRLRPAQASDPATGDTDMQNAAAEVFVDGAEWVMGTDPTSLKVCDAAVAEGEADEAGADSSADQHIGEQPADQGSDWAAAAAADDDQGLAGAEQGAAAAADDDQGLAGAEQAGAPAAAAGERPPLGQEGDDEGDLAGIDPGVRSVAEQQRQRHQKEDSRQGVAAHTAATAGARGNLISGVRSFVPLVAKKDPVPPVAAGKVKVKVKALEVALAAKQAEDMRAQERAARQRQQLEQQQLAKTRAAASTTAAEGVTAAVGSKPQGTFSHTGQALPAPAAGKPQFEMAAAVHAPTAAAYV